LRKVYQEIRGKSRLTLTAVTLHLPILFLSKEALKDLSLSV